MSREDLTSWISTTVKEVGFPIAVACVLLYMTQQQGSDMAARLNKLNDYVMVELQTQVRETTAANAKAAEALVRASIAIEQNSKMLEATNVLLTQLLSERRTND